MYPQKLTNYTKDVLSANQKQDDGALRTIFPAVFTDMFLLLVHVCDVSDVLLSHNKATDYSLIGPALSDVPRSPKACDQCRVGSG